jgi:hypothetical protein
MFDVCIFFVCDLTIFAIIHFDFFPNNNNYYCLKTKIRKIGAQRFTLLFENFLLFFTFLYYREEEILLSSEISIGKATS